MADSDLIWCVSGENSWTECAEISYVVRGTLARRLTEVNGGLHVHLHTCARVDVHPFPYLGNGWTDCARIWCVVRGQLAMFVQRKDICASAGVTVHTFNHIYSLLLVHRPKDVLLV